MGKQDPQHLSDQISLPGPAALAATPAAAAAQHGTAADAAAERPRRRAAGEELRRALCGGLSGGHEGVSGAGAAVPWP